MSDAIERRSAVDKYIQAVVDCWDMAEQEARQVMALNLARERVYAAHKLWKTAVMKSAEARSHLTAEELQTAAAKLRIRRKERQSCWE